MKGREDMFKLLQNEYEEYQEYFKELELIQRQYNQEEAYYFIINKLIRDSIDDKDISVRDVHKLIKAKDFPGRNEDLRGYDGQVPDFVILANDFNEREGKDQSGKVYGCVEIKPFSEAKRQGKDTRKLYSEYISPIKNLLENKKLVKEVEVVHEKISQNWIKIEFEPSEKKEEFIENYFKEDNKPIPISLENGGIKGKVFLCDRNQNLCLQIEENESIKFEEGQIKQLKIGMRNNEVVLVPRESEKLKHEYLVELKRKKIKELFFQEKKECCNCNTIVCELLKELIGFKKVIFTNGYQWILMQCKEVEYSETEFEKEKDKNGIKVTSPIMVKGFQCESLANFYPEPKDEATFNRLVLLCLISLCKENAQCEEARKTIKKKDSEKINQAINSLKNCYLKKFLEVEDINEAINKAIQDIQDINNESENLDKFEPGSVSGSLDLGLNLTEFQTGEDFKAWTAMTFAELQQHNFEQWLHLKLEINRIFKEAKSQNKQGEEKIGNDE